MTDNLLGSDRSPSADADDAHDATARLGLVGHGTYYLLLALLTFRLAGGSSEQTDASGAIAAVAKQPFGQLLLGGLTIAFAAYAIHRWAGAVRGDETWERVENAIRAVVWTGLTLLAGRSLMDGLSGGGGNEKAQGLTAVVLGWPGGALLVGAVGLAFVYVSVRQFRRAFSDSLIDELHELGLEGRRAAKRLGQVGYTGRGVAYGAVALFILHAAWTHDPEAGRGLDGALQQLRQAPYGTWVLFGVAIGFAAFGVFRLVEARYEADAT